MLPDNMKQYVHIYESKADMHAKVQEWSKLTISDRQAIADACYSMTSKSAYTKRLVDICINAVNKYKNNVKNGLHLDQFMI
jgi:hypothetical protein